MLDSDSSRGGGQRSGTAGQLLSGIGNVYTPTWGCDVTTAKPPVNTEEGVFSEDDDEFQIRTYPPSLLAAPVQQANMTSMTPPPCAHGCYVFIRGLSGKEVTHLNGELARLGAYLPRLGSGSARWEVRPVDAKNCVRHQVVSVMDANIEDAELDTIELWIQDRLEEARYGWAMAPPPKTRPGARASAPATSPPSASSP